MSNIVLKGDVIQDLGEYLPNPYIERIEVTTTEPDQVGIEIQYSLLFMISDEYDANDIIEQLNNINLFACFKSENTASQLSKNEVMFHLTNTTTSTFVDFNFYQLDSESIIKKLSNGDYADDLYDSEDRRVLKVSATTSYNLETTGTRTKIDLKNDKTETFDVEQYTEHVYCYMLSSLLNSATLTDSTISKAYLNTSNIAYEKVFSPGLNVLREEEVIYLGTQGEKYGYTPLLALNRNYYKTQTISRETIISKVNSLIKRFKNRSVGPLADSVNSIKYVLREESESENLLVELDKVRRSFPNKTNNNPVGNLYAAYSKLLQNINSSFPPSDRLTKQKYLTGKVLDLRAAPVAEYVIQEPSSLSEYIPKDMFFLHRERISEDETSDLAINRGMFFIRYEEMFKRESNIASLLNIDKLYETVSGTDLESLKRMLFSYFRVTEVYVEKGCYEDESLVSLQQNNLRYASVATDRLNRAAPPTLSYFPTAPTAVEEVDSQLKNSIKEYNFAFDNPDERLLSYAILDIDSYTALYEMSQIDQYGSMNFAYYINATFYDETQEFAEILLNKFIQINDNLRSYVALSEQRCSFNNIDNRFNGFFVDSIRGEYPDEVYPWEAAPAIYTLMVYVLTDQFDSFEDAIRYSKNVAATISPESGNLQSLTDFAVRMDNLRDNQVAVLEATLKDSSFHSFINLKNIGKDLRKDFSLLPLDYVQLIGEVDAEFESLFRNQMNYYDGKDIVVAPSGTAVYLEDGSPPNAPSTKTKAEFMALLLEAIEEFFLVYTLVFGGDANYSFDDTQQASLGSHIQSFINNLQKLFRGKRNETLKEKGFTMFQFGAIGNKTIDDPNVKNYENIFLRQVAAIYREANPAGTRVDFGYMYQSFGTMTNLIYNYYNSPRVSGDKQNLQYDISVGDFAHIPGESEIKNWIVFDLAPALPMAMGTYTGPEIFEIAGIEDISF